MAQKPKLFVTRKLPPDVEARLRHDYDALHNDNDAVYGPDDLVRLSMETKCEGILTCGTEKWTADVISRLPDHVKVLATFSVG
ncbi:MAG: D-glycerate dehydrogenase, partial [Alphaproteobacteria bacterium]|nr:D-glycerate dehydrogenase [Alphaproteobacteria bacterium]